MRIPNSYELAIVFGVAAGAISWPGSDAARAETNAEAVAGIWALQQVSGSGQLTSLTSSINNALDTPGVRGFCLRVPWNAIDASFAVLNQGKAIADGQGVAFSIRFMAGRHTPARVFDDAGCPYYLSEAGERIPRPFLTDGSPNLIFEQQWGALVANLANYCRTNGIRLLHLSWHAQEWAELYHGLEVRNLTGYSLNNFYESHRRLMEIALQHAGPDLAVEFPFSGHGPLTDLAGRFADYVYKTIGPSSDLFFCQANGWGPNGDWGAPNAQTEAAFDANVWTKPICRGLQSIQPEDYNWAVVFQHLYQNDATYGEIYVPSFGNSQPPKSVLEAEIAAFAAHVAKAAPVPPGAARMDKSCPDNVRMMNADTGGPHYLPYEWMEFRDPALDAAKGFYTDNDLSQPGDWDTGAFAGAAPPDNERAIAVRFHDNLGQSLRLESPPFRLYESGRMRGDLTFHVALTAPVEGQVNWEWSRQNSYFFGVSLDGLDYGADPPLAAAVMFLNGTRDMAAMVSPAIAQNGQAHYQQWGAGPADGDDFPLNHWLRFVIRYDFRSNQIGEIQFKVDHGEGVTRSFGPPIAVKAQPSQNPPPMRFNFHTNGVGRTPQGSPAYLDDVIFWAASDITPPAPVSLFQAVSGDE